MTNINNIQESLQRANILTVGPIVQDSENHFFVYIPIARDSQNRQQPTNLSLKEVQAELKSQNINVDFLLSDATAENIEIGLRATLLHSFGEYLRNVFLSIDRRVANVWFDQKKEINDDSLVQIKSMSKIYLDTLKIELGTFLTTSNENLPGKLVCLKQIRLLSPASLVELRDALLARNFTVPSDDWLKRKLDLYRKDKSIVRLVNERYALTGSALINLGTTRTRDSPDISRLLALTTKNM